MGPISDAFNGQGDSQVGLDAGLTRDIWTVINPDLTPLQSEISHGDQVFLNLMTSLTPVQARNPALVRAIEVSRARAIVGLTSRFVTHPWPVNFLMIVSPLVTWIWLGALIMGVGGLIALWPIPTAARRRVTARSAAPRAAPPAVAGRETA
jgi:cytochrome c-type biogenesis protein CcmF